MYLELPPVLDLSAPIRPAHIIDVASTLAELNLFSHVEPVKFQRAISRKLFRLGSFGKQI